MKFLFAVVFLLSTGCVTAEKTFIKREEKPVSPPLREFLDSPALLLADRISVHLQADLYSEAQYRVDKNFHEFSEKREPSRIIMRLINTSKIIDQPVKFWLSKFECVATEWIEVFFDRDQPGFLLEASGEVLWKKGDQTQRAQKLLCRDGEIQLFEKPR